MMGSYSKVMIKSALTFIASEIKPIMSIETTTGTGNKVMAKKRHFKQVSSEPVMTTKTS